VRPQTAVEKGDFESCRTGTAKANAGLTDWKDWAGSSVVLLRK